MTVFISTVAAHSHSGFLNRQPQFGRVNAAQVDLATYCNATCELKSSQFASWLALQLMGKHFSLFCLLSYINLFFYKLSTFFLSGKG